MYAPGAGESQDTSGGSAVIGLAWRIQSVSCRVDRPLDVLRGPAGIRDASRLIRHAQRLPAIDGALGLAAWRGAIVTDDPFVTDGRPGHQPIAQATHGSDDAGVADPR